MDAIKQQLARIQEQLAQLSASQKMLVFSLVAVMVLTLMFWSRYAGSADMEPVLDQALKADEISRITASIRGKGIEYKVVGDRVLVSADRKLEVLADLSFNQLVPQDTRGAYDEILKRISPWSSQSDNDATRNEAKASLLAQIIRQFPGVQNASVIIDPTERRTIGGGGPQPTASILIMTKDPTSKRGDRTLVDAAASTVNGAQAGLDLKHINVVVNGVRYRVNDHDEMGIGGGDDILVLRQQNETAMVQKIQQQLSFAGNVLVSVTAEVNLVSETRDEEKYDAQHSLTAETESTTETQEESAPPAAPAEPGAASNVALAVGESGGASSGNASTREKTISKSQVVPGGVKIRQNKPGGDAKFVGAAVRVPLSYFISEWKRKNPSTSSREPDDTALQPLITDQIARIKNEVKKCTMIASDDDVSVEPYNDNMPLLAGTTTVTTAAGATSTAGISALLGVHYKEIVLGALALVSLFMVSSVIKKGATSPSVPTAMELSEAPALSSGEDVAGDVGEGTSTLDGMELDPDAVRAQQMVEQVSTMVTENPDGAANLVKRWLNRS